LTLGIFFTSLGYLTGLFVLFSAAREKKLLTAGMGNVAAAAFLGGIVGARVTEWVFSGWPFRMSFWSILDPSTGGKALLGGLFFGWISALVAKKRMGIKRSTGDLFALALPAGEAIGRIGCYYNQCCYGTVTTSSLAVYQHGAFRHPAQLYSSATAALMFALLFGLRNRLSREGDLFRLYLILFGFSRFALEFIRERPLVLGGLSAMQWFCIELFVAGSATLAISFRRGRKEGLAVP